MTSLYSKRSELIDFFKLFRDLKDLEPSNDDDDEDTKKHNNKVMNKVHQLYFKYFDTYKKECNSDDLNKEDKNFFDPNQYKILSNKKQKWSIGQPTQSKQLNLNELSKISWIEVPRKNFELLIKEVANNLEDKDYKITVKGVYYDLKRQKNSC